ncbi:MAPEG family protein [Comamonas sp. Y33R10-2]|uniref:MAPEG family protein n=1 Tax=Comamonas sp. Y33R10-2 TaxID=2853257 RepID=UPI001C5C911A|nr:MAPEG family protein [Comamonas sp. Y33R10-2]QXZ10649.1 MAPEG family protein [Comamonas sp. Y33R10-2]
MTLAEICILIACLLPIVCAGIAKSKSFGKPHSDGGFDNNNPRLWLANLQGWQARAHAAQLNSFEALPLFIAGVLVAQHHNANQYVVNALAASFIVMRIGYIWMYLIDFASFRSVLWALGLVSCIAQFFI